MSSRWLWVSGRCARFRKDTNPLAIGNLAIGAVKKRQPAILDKHIYITIIE